MREVIYKDEAYKAIDNCICDGWYRISPSEAKMNIRYLVSDAIEVNRPQGKWIVPFPYKDTGNTRMCSNCNITQTVNVYDGVVRFKFCPYCGANMRGDEE